MEGDDKRYYYYCCPNISIHSLRMEGDAVTGVDHCIHVYFNPLPPHGGRPPTERDDKRRLAISIHSLRMEGDIKRYLITVRRMEISIHSLRMEGDFRSWHCVDRTDISIHSLRMEGDI